MRQIPTLSPVAPAALALLFACVGAPAWAALDLPVWTPGSSVAAPYYRGDVLEVQLSPSAARVALPRGAGATRARAVGRLGVPAVDAAAAAAGAIAFEPEFRGELPPGEGGGPDFTAFQLVHLAPGADLERALETLRALPEVISADPIAVLPVSALPNDSLAFATYWLYRDQPVRRDIRAPEAWQVTTGDTSIVVAILDTGVVPYHPDLGGRAGERGQMWQNWREREGAPGVDDDGNGYVDDIAGWDFVKQPEATLAGAGEDARDEDNDPNDYGGHGTAVAGIVGAIAGNGIGLAGVAPSVQLMALRMGWYSTGITPTGNVDMSFAAAAVRYATRNGAHVLNCSWQSLNQAGLDAAITAATRAGVVVVNAAGNSSTTFTYLGERPDVISVCATDSTDKVWSNSVVGPWVDLAAAGVGMSSTMIQRLSTSDSLAGRTPSYKGFINGTSFSAPQVTGAVVLLQAQRRAQGADLLTPAGVLLRLRETTDDIRAQNPIVSSGYGTGRLNLFRALTDPTGSLAVRTHARTLGAPVVLRFNTGRVRVVYTMSDRSIVAFDGATGDTAWVRTLPAVPSGQLAAAEFGQPRGALIVVPAQNGNVFALHEDGRPAQGWPVLAQAGVNMSAGAVFADLDGDGSHEVVAGGTAISGSRLWAWSADGTPLAGFPFDPASLGMSAPAAGDLDGVPGDELAFTDGNGALRVVRGNGSELAGFPSAAASAARAPVLARLGGPGTPASVLMASAGTLTAFAADGSTRWSAAVPGTPVQDPALADLDGDGVDEIVLAMSTPSAIVVLDVNGAPYIGKPGWPAPLAAPAAGPLVVGPLAAAHGPGVLFFQSGGLVALDDSAHVLATFPKPGGAGQAPTLADLDGDDATEVAAGTALADSNLYTYDAGAGSWSEPLAHWPTPRGDFARTASHAAGTPAPLVLDRVRPAAVTNLEATSLGTTSVRITWNETGDDSLSGTADRVVLRRAPFALDDANFNTGFFVPTNVPGPPGSADTVLVAPLPEGSTWWFALRVLDDVGNASAVSNADSASLLGEPPAAIGDLRALAVGDTIVVLTWTATGDDGGVGRPQAYQISGSTQPLDVANVDAAPLQIRRPAFHDAGQGETTAVFRLTSGRRWRFAVRGVDRSSTLGPISNLLEVVTPVGGALAGRSGLALAPRPMPATADVTVDWQGDPNGTTPHWLVVYDLSGRERRRIALGKEPGGSYSWNGRDGDSRLLPAGLYFLRLVSGARHADSRVVFIR